MIEVAQEARLVEEELDLLALHRRKDVERDLLDLAVAARQFSAMHGRQPPAPSCSWTTYEP